MSPELEAAIVVATNQPIDVGKTVQVADGNLVVVPDVAALEADANGQRTPVEEWGLTQEDGRTIFIFTDSRGVE